MRRTLSAAYTPRTQAYPPVSAYVRVCPPHCPPRTMSEADKKVRRGLRGGVRQSARIRADTPRTLTYPPRIGGQSAADCPWKSPPRTMSAAWRHSDNIRRGQCTPRTMSAAYKSTPRTMSAADTGGCRRTEANNVRRGQCAMCGAENRFSSNNSKRIMNAQFSSWWSKKNFVWLIF